MSGSNRPWAVFIAAAQIAQLFVAVSVRASAWHGIDRLPGATPVTVQVSGKPRIYFRATAQTPLQVTVMGPGALRITSRVELPAGPKSVVTYSVRAAEGGRVLEEMSTETSVGSEAEIDGGGSRLGKSRKMTIELAAGAHALQLSVGGAGSLLLRLQQRGEANAEPSMVTLTPVSAARSVSVAEGEKTIPYFSVMPGRPVRLRVVGPTSLDLLTRLDFDATMRGNVSYRLRVTEGERTLRMLEFTTSKASTASFTNLPDRVPSKFGRTELQIPAGLHELTIALIRPAGGVAEIHARIPQPSVGNEE